MELTVAHDFISAVLHRSETVPVVVDFWAPWCGPCKVFKPILEKLASEARGHWVLVTVNTEKFPELAQQFGVRGIPDVKLFSKGNVIAQFSGALPEPLLRSWLMENLPAPDRRPEEFAQDELSAGRWADAEATLTGIRPSERTPAQTDLLALARVFRHPQGALTLVGDRRTAHADSVRTLAGLLALGPDDLPEYSAKLPLLAGIAELHAGRLPEALRLFIASMEESVRYADGAASRACLAIFAILGPQHPLTEEFAPAHRRTTRA